MTRRYRFFLIVALLYLPQCTQPSKSGSGITCSTTGSNPSDDVSAFITAAYNFVLARNPTPAEITLYSAQLNKGVSSAPELMLDLMQSESFWNRFGGRPTSNESYFSITFRYFFGREMDPAELALWTALPNTQISWAQFTRWLFTRDDFRTRHPNLVLKTNQCALGVNDATFDSAPALSACISLSSEKALICPGKYYVSSAVKIESKSDVLIASSGMETPTVAPPCLAQTDEDPRCAIIVASPTLKTTRILELRNGNNVRFQYVALDGNRHARRAALGDYSLQTGWRDGANGRLISCSHCSFMGFASVRAMAEKGLHVVSDRTHPGDSDYLVVSNSLFRDNGFGVGRPGYTLAGNPLSDGLAVENSKGLIVENSFFQITRTPS